MKNTRKLIAVIGPTASGKSELAVKLAKILGGEVISADSRLVYRDFNIGTAKPTPEETENIPHHLIDVESPQNTYTAGRYKKEAEQIIEEIFNRKKIPIIAGGTGFYIKALLEGLNIPEILPNKEFRDEMNLLAQKNGNSFLYEKLKKTDPEIALKIMPNDIFRIIRALEVYKITGKTMTELQTKTLPDYEILYIGLTAKNRNFLYEKINRRVLIMIEKGLEKEVKFLLNKYGEVLSLLNTLGYKEMREYLSGNISLETAILKIQQNTRNFAKRQLTWFRANEKIKWFFIDEKSQEEIITEYTLQPDVIN